MAVALQSTFVDVNELSVPGKELSRLVSFSLLSAPKLGVKNHERKTYSYG